MNSKSTIKIPLIPIADAKSHKFNKRRLAIIMIMSSLVIWLLMIEFKFHALHNLLPTIHNFNTNIKEDYIYDTDKPNSNQQNDLLPEWIISYNNLTSSNSFTKYLVYQCYHVCGGIGDRLHAIVSLYYIALRTQRQLIIDSPTPYPLINVLIPNKVNWNQASNVYELSTRKIHIYSIDHWHESLQHPHQLDKYQLVTVNFNLLRFDPILFDNPQLKRLKTEEQKRNLLFKWAFLSLFKRSVALNQAITDTKSKLGINNNDYISIHVRIGNDADISWNDPERHSIEDIDTFLDCAHKIGNTSFHQQHLLLFVASDSQKAKDLMKSKDKDVRIANTTIYHIDRSPHTDAELVQTGTMDAFVEFMMLADAKCIVRSRSGFSKIPAMLNADTQGVSCSVQFDQC